LRSDEEATTQSPCTMAIAAMRPCRCHGMKLLEEREGAENKRGYNSSGHSQPYGIIVMSWSLCVGIVNLYVIIAMSRSTRTNRREER
jgi:hypothetical protein